LKLLHYPLLFKVAKWKCICPDYHQFYVQPYPHAVQQQFNYYQPAGVPLQIRQTYAQPLVYRPTKSYAQVEKYRQSVQTVGQAFNFRPTTTKPQPFNFRPTAPKLQQLYSNVTARPYHQVIFPSSTNMRTYTESPGSGYSLNYNFKIIPPMKDQDPEPIVMRPTVAGALNFGPLQVQEFQDFYDEYNAAAAELPIDKFEELSTKMDLKVFFKSIRRK
jgi:hypothetical protein